MALDLLSDRRGTSAVEFAVIAPLFIATILGMVAYGIYFGASHSIQQIAADAARASVAGIDDAERREIAARYVRDNSGGYPFIRADRVTLELGGSEMDPELFRVLIRYDARELPIWGLFDRVPMPSTTIRRQSQIRIGGS